MVYFQRSKLNYSKLFMMLKNVRMGVNGKICLVLKLDDSATFPPTVGFRN